MSRGKKAGRSDDPNAAENGTEPPHVDAPRSGESGGAGREEAGPEVDLPDPGASTEPRNRRSRREPAAEDDRNAALRGEPAGGGSSTGLRSAARVSLILFGTGFLGFSTGVLAAVLVYFGILDLDTLGITTLMDILK